MIGEHAIPYFPRGVRLKYDALRKTWVLLAPERAIMLDQIGHAILAEVDGDRNCHEIAGTLGPRYNAPASEIIGDCVEFLSGLVARRFVEVTA